MNKCLKEIDRLTSTLGLVLGSTLAKTEHLRGLVLLLLDLLSGALTLLGQTVSGKAVSGFVLLGSLYTVVDQGEASGLSTTEISSESEGEHSVYFTDLQELWKITNGEMD